VLRSIIPSIVRDAPIMVSRISLFSLLPPHALERLAVGFVAHEAIRPCIAFCPETGFWVFDLGTFADGSVSISVFFGWVGEILYLGSVS
jgi:hypothetical protein